MYDIHGFATKIYDSLGPGHSERTYHNAFEVLLRSRGIPYESERIVPIKFMGHVVGHMRCDIIINNEIILEFKTIKSLNDLAEIQVRNYLNLTGLKRSILVNFPPHLDRRVETREIEVEEGPQMVESSQSV